ncbi:hypothetical protein TNCV_1401861 [Trichonephila clavipes]|nr:hypothetical protein TNCV_1401861 [Trichonephila clavipes]
MITNVFIPELNNHDVQELWFQQDGATCHTARATIDLLKDTFGDRLISRFRPVNWPPRSCDLTPLDYFLWGYVKSLVYADKPQTLDHLEDNIRRVIADIRPQMLEKIIENGTSRLDYIEPALAVLCQKSYLKCSHPQELRCLPLERKLDVKIICGDWYPPIWCRTKKRYQLPGNVLGLRWEYPVSEKTIHAMERRLANLIGLWQTGTSPIAPNRFEESGGPLNTCATLRMGGVEL